MRLPHDCSTRYVLAMASLVLLWLLGWVPAAHAQSAICTGPGTVTLNFGTITIPASDPPGTLEPTGGSAVNATATFTCDKINGANSVIFNADVASSSPYTFDSPTSGIITFQTNLAGVGLQLTPSHPSTASHTATSFPAGTIPPPAPGQTTQSYSAQLVKTAAGAVASGTISNFSLVNYSITWTGGGNAVFTNASSLTIGSAKIISGSCDSLNVTATLPAVFASQLSNQGAVFGKTPVPLNFTNCPAGAQVSISFNGTAATIGGTPSTNVLASSGGAQNVGVQLLDNNGNPVDITGTITTVLNSSVPASGSVSGTYYAQYYATGSAGPGSVNAVATYTLTYQ